MKPDVFVKTRGDRWFVIDSKAPMTAFDKYVSAESEEDKKSALKELGSNFKSHIKKILYFSIVSFMYGSRINNAIMFTEI